MFVLFPAKLSYTEPNNKKKEDGFLGKSSHLQKHTHTKNKLSIQKTKDFYKSLLIYIFVIGPKKKKEI